MRIGDGHGVTELISACNYEAIANGVGIYSFTHHLITELKLLSSTKRRFTAAELWAHIYHRMQSHIPKGIKNERYPAPVHYFITEDPNFPRSIEISVLSVTPQSSADDNHEESTPKTDRPQSKRPSAFSNDMPNTKKQCMPTSLMAIPIASHSNLGLEGNEETSRCQPRTMLFSIRLEETFSAQDLVLEAFVEWCRSIPTSAQGVKVEAQFESDSTILILRAPLPLWTCLKDHPAIATLGPVTSSNILATPTIISNQTVDKKEPVKGTKENASSSGGMVWDDWDDLDVNLPGPENYNDWPQSGSEVDEVVSKTPSILSRLNDWSMSTAASDFLSGFPLAENGLMTFNESSFALAPEIGREKQSARDHPLYDAFPQADGLFHCPWESKATCSHPPVKSKADYE